MKDHCFSIKDHNFMYKDLTLAFSKQQCIKGPRGMKQKNVMILFNISAGYYVFWHPSHPRFDVFI